MTGQKLKISHSVFCGMCIQLFKMFIVYCKITSVSDLFAGLTTWGSLSGFVGVLFGGLAPSRFLGCLDRFKNIQYPTRNSQL